MCRLAWAAICLPSKSSAGMTRPPPSEADVATWIAAHITTNTALRQALDTILEQLQMISQARECLQANNRTWFVQTLRTELEALGNLTHFEAHLTGDGAIAQGPGAVAAGQGGVAIGGSVHGNVSLRSGEERKA